MIYIRKNGEVLEKYEMVYDKQKLEELMIRIAKNCGEIHDVKREMEFSYFPKENSWRYDYILGDVEKTLAYVENVKYKKNGKRTTHWYEYDDEVVDLYDCNFTLYFVPPIVDFIKSLIEGSEASIAALFNRDLSLIENLPTVEEKIAYYNGILSKHQEELIRKRKEKIEELSKKCGDINSNSAKLIKELAALEKNSRYAMKNIKFQYDSYMGIRDLNKNQQPVEPYIEELLSLIKFRLVDTIELSEVQRINSFFTAGCTNMQNSEVLKRVLKNSNN
ncbi:MAG: hypothetical protein IJK67_02295 [Bacilli bacterium]|nr:hypothetical protein [Bacilli bacterium]